MLKYSIIFAMMIVLALSHGHDAAKRTEETTLKAKIYRAAIAELKEGEAFDTVAHGLWNGRYTDNDGGRRL